MKSISILGSTGSIGVQALEVARENKFKVAGLSCNSSIDILKKQVDEFKPDAVAVYDKEKADMLDLEIPVYSGLKGILKIAALDTADTVLNSLVGSIGVMPTVEAIGKGKNIALANKETLVAAGDIVMREAAKKEVAIMPIDSEHSAIFQCLNGEDSKAVNKVIITCSGGAFKNLTRYQLSDVKAEDALKHPTWDMGAKITIDSATLMNKGFEVIEAHHLYSLPYEQIDVVIHPQSIVHSFVEFNDRSVMAQLGMPSMKIPIQYALTYPSRIKNKNLPKLNLAKIKSLDFKEPDRELFPCLEYAYEAGKAGGTMPAVLNAANEVAVEAFLRSKIKFLDIPRLVREAMDRHSLIKNPSLSDIMDLDARIKEEVSGIIEE